MSIYRSTHKDHLDHTRSDNNTGNKHSLIPVIIPYKTHYIPLTRHLQGNARIWKLSKQNAFTWSLGLWPDFRVVVKELLITEKKKKKKKNTGSTSRVGSWSGASLNRSYHTYIGYRMYRAYTYRNFRLTPLRICKSLNLSTKLCFYWHGSSTFSAALYISSISI